MTTLARPIPTLLSILRTLMRTPMRTPMKSARRTGRRFAPRPPKGGCREVTVGTYEPLEIRPSRGAKPGIASRGTGPEPGSSGREEASGGFAGGPGPAGMSRPAARIDGGARFLQRTAGALLPWLLAALAAAGPAAAAAQEAELRFQPAPRLGALAPPLPPLAQYPVQLVLDDDGAEGNVGVVGAASRQFLWFNRYTPGTALLLQEVWVLFLPGPEMSVGAAVELAVYQDGDGDPANGATLLASFPETIQVLDGSTFSVYPLPAPVAFDGTGDLLIGVVPRFITSGVTPPVTPAAIDTTASQVRSWIGVWSADPPSPPVLVPPPDQQLEPVDGFLPGNWMIRGFGTGFGPAAVEVPALGAPGLAGLALLLATAGALLLARRRNLALLLLPAAFALGSPAAGQTTIDTFTTNQAVMAAPPGGASSVATGGADILGLRRDLVPFLLAGAGPVQASVTGGQLLLTVTATTPDSRGEAEVTWDGDANPNVLSPTGLSSADLTAGGAAGFRIRVASSTVASELELIVYSGPSDISRAGRFVPATASPVDVYLPFAELAPDGGTGADLADVGAIVLVVRAREGEVRLDEVVASQPILAATKVDALVTDTDGDGRVDPGDRVRYTITLTNAGNQAVAVDLDDTPDANTALVPGSVSSTPIARNDQYFWVGNATLTADGSAARPGLLANDGDPDGDTVTVQSVAGASSQGGAVSLVDASTGTFTYAPPSGFSGVDTFTYTIVDGDSNVATATATVILDGVIWFVDDSNTTPPHLGTLADPFQSLASLGGTDPDQPGDTIFVFDDDGTPYPGGLVLEAEQRLFGEAEGLEVRGAVIVAPGGRPQITNAAGTGLQLAADNTVMGLDVSGTSGTGIAGNAFGTATLENVNVLNAGGSALDLANGTLAATFGTLSSTGTGGQRGILLATVAGSLAAATTSLTNPTTDGIRVQGSAGASFSFGATTITDTSLGAAPAANGIDLTTGNAGASFSFASLAVTSDGGVGLAANNSGTIQIAGTGNTIAATGGPALTATATSFGTGVTFATLSSTNSPVVGVNLDGVTGPFTATGGAISNAGGVAFDLNGGSSAVTYGGSVSNIANVLLIDVTGRTGGTATFSGNLSGTSSSNGINVSGNTGGTITFSGATKTLNTGADAAVTLSANTGATIAFTGGGLDVDTTSGTGFLATGGAAAVSVQGSGNTINSGTGTPLNVTSTTIAAAGLTFQSISANGGTSGIVLNGTGANGGLSVTGTGSAGSGGTIQNKAIGVSLTNTRNVSLTRMQLNDFGDFAIRGTSVVGFTLADSVISGTNGNDAGADEGSIRFTGLTGSATISGSNISGAVEDNVAVVNTTGTLNRLTLSGTTIGANSTTTGGDGLFIEAQGSAVLNVTVQSSFFTSSRGDLAQFNLAGAGSMDVVVQGTAFSDNHPAIVSGGGGVILGGTAGSMTFNVDGNTFRDATGTALAVSCGNAGQSCVGRIQNNQIGLVATANSGSTGGGGIAVVSSGGGTLTAAVTGNQVRQVNNHGILLQAGQTLGNPTSFNATVTGNTVSNPGNLNTDFNGIHLNNGTVPGENHTACVDIRNNSIAGAGAGVTPPNNADYRLRQRQSTTVRLPGYGGANNNDAAVVAFVSGNQTTVTTGAASNTVASGGGGFVGGASCPLPP